MEFLNLSTYKIGEIPCNVDVVAPLEIADWLVDEISSISVSDKVKIWQLSPFSNVDTFTVSSFALETLTRRAVRKENVNEKYFNLLQENKFLYSTSDAGYTTDNKILSTPTVNNTPVSPNRKLVYISFFFIGFIIGVGILFVKYLTFNEINLIDDLNKLLPVPLLGNAPALVPLIKISKKPSLL